MAGSARLRGNGVSLSIDRSSWKEGAARLQFSLRVTKDRIEGEARDGEERFVLKAKRLTE